ncbi:MAG: HEAT repeat domain-containing protein, partial [Pirellulaceae bacterium]|nr:HEAT repeat domain-containing protein [Pirellulaceae bacterium]
MAAAGGAAAGGAAAANGGPSDQRAMLLQRMRRQSVHHLRRDLASAEAEVRAAAAQTVGSRGIQLVDELIPLLSDTDPGVRQEAHQALVRLGRGVDFGPESLLASADEIHEASLLWHDWWQQNKDRQGISEDTPKQADERIAEQKLRQAEQLLLGGREDAAQRRLRELVAEFPRTAAAERAHTYLTP